jgi:predicted metal-dependent TIM-barrel fold hydrolase
VIESVGLDQHRIYLDHNTEDTIEIALQRTQCWCGLTVYPISKLDADRASAIVSKVGSERIIVSGSADWGISDPVSLPKVIDRMRQDGHAEETLQRIAFGNSNRFYSQCRKWKPDLTLEPWKIELRQP